MHYDLTVDEVSALTAALSITAPVPSLVYHDGSLTVGDDVTPALADAIAAALAPGATVVLSAVRAARIADAWAECDRRCESESIAVTTSAGTYRYGLDGATRGNLQMAAIGLLAGIQAFPRDWTPKGAAQPIQILADDLKLIAGAVGTAYDARVQAYLLHKGALKDLSSVAAVTAYDLTTGWPPDV